MAGYRMDCDGQAATGRPTIAELYVYPVKACQGVRVREARLSASGFELDRAFCVVDLSGKRHPEREALSQRKLPALAAIGVALSTDGGRMTLSAPGQPDLQLDTDPAAFAGEAAVDADDAKVAKSRRACLKAALCTITFCHVSELVPSHDVVCGVAAMITSWMDMSDLFPSEADQKKLL